MHVIGTAGHVDHGKSTLVEALTGMDPDRLREEKERGLTIDLGFAWMELDDEREVSIVDVPGHERFVGNMLAGVGGIDLAMLVVAADESVMPQTREHLAILDLLNVDRGLIVMTKSDLVDEEWRELVSAEIEETVAETSLREAPIVEVSAVSGQGLAELRSTMRDLLDDMPSRSDLGRPRLPVDRSFTIAGFGAVVTGTLVDGSLSVGQEVELALSGSRARIRGLQTQKTKVDVIGPGNRVAANLSGVRAADVDRGDVLTTPGWLERTAAIDVRLRMIADAPRAARHNMFVNVHAGSGEAVGRLRLLDADALEPGSSAWAQLKLETPMAVVKGDYFVIRAGGSTLGGGNVVDPHAPRHRRRHEPLLDRLQAMESGSGRDVLLKMIEASEPSSLGDLVNRANMAAEDAVEELAGMTEDGLVVTLGPAPADGASVFYSATGWARLKRRARESLEAYHKQFPLRPGTPKEELRSRLGISSQVSSYAVPKLIDEGVLAEDHKSVRLPDHAPQLTSKQQGEVDRYLKSLEMDPYSPPSNDGVEADVLSWLEQQGKVVRVSDGVVFSTGAYDDMVRQVRKCLEEKGQISVGDARDMFGNSRKYILALMDHLDRRQVTRRVGDYRVLR